MKKFTNNRGFTLVELMVVVAIITIFSGVVLVGVGTAMRDYSKKTELYAKKSGGFEADAFSQMQEDFTREDPPTQQDIINALESANLGVHFGNIQNYNMAQSNSNWKEEALVEAISDALGTDEFFAQLYHNTDNNTKQLFIYTEGTLSVADCPKTSEVIVLSYTQQGEFLWSGRANATFVPVSNNPNRGITVDNNGPEDISYNPPAEETTPVIPQTTQQTQETQETQQTQTTTNSGSYTGSVSTNTWGNGGQATVDLSQYRGYTTIIVVFQVDGNVTSASGWGYDSYTVNGNTVTAQVSANGSNSWGISGNNGMQVSGSNVNNITVVSVSAS